jgi:hypothetical protein
MPSKFAGRKLSQLNWDGVLKTTVKQIQYAVCITRICINKNGQKPHLLEEAPKGITVAIKEFLSRN